MRFSVLVVDDNRIASDRLADSLRSEPDIEVVGTASNGREAVAFARTHVPDFILMDLDMPIMNGIEATTHICSELPSVKVIVLSNYDDDDHLFGAFKAGATGYVMKGATSEEIAACIRERGNQVVFLPSTLSLRVIAEFNRVSNQSHRKKAPYSNLTAQEREVLKQIAAGKTNKQIATVLFIEPVTVRNHVTNILHKLVVNNRLEAAQLAVELGIVDRSPAPGSQPL
ncbi:MAG: liaR [Chthonomonadaceae bacterium]|nr:liaR [Chthonomonadaceae bacterium]